MHNSEHTLNLSLSLPSLRATTPFHVMFEVPPQLQPHLEVVPKHGLVQGQSAFAAQVKFLPKSSILESGDCRRFYDEAGGYYSMPVHIQVADQVSCT